MNEKMPPNGNIVVWIAIAILILVAGIYFFSMGNRSPKPSQSSISELNSSEKIITPEETNKNTRTFDISAKPFEFSVKEIQVKKGDKVKINLSVSEGMHDWVVDEFGAKTKIIQAGQSDSIEFLADKVGTFEYYCSVPTHRQRGMVGRLIVE